MSLRIKDSYATVFSVENHDKFVSCDLSTGRKVKDEDGTDKYINSYWRATFVGSCLDLAKALSDKDRIKINSASISHEKSNKQDPATGKFRYFYNVTIFEFEPVLSKKTESSDEEISDSEDLPF